ncbi:MAG: UDP-N-acetylmuramate--L-alanine ligase [Lachnospiraceae bacterium]|nr:UDP-N-acetylmuramate--L-alanine ligase [Lachnospiraceae bacterium]
MVQINFDQPIHVHFIGIGGISMSGLAAVLLSRGFTVTGSDSRKSEQTSWLESLGAHISIPQSAANITDGIDLVVYTAAIHPDNPEYAAAEAAGIPMMPRAELLGQLMTQYPTSVAVAGTHGKTTTTSMIAHIMMAQKMDPTISVGGILPSIGGNIRVGHSGSFLTEACEYTNSFLHLTPQIGVILNIDADHLDFFKDLDDIRHSFRLFAEKIPAGGTLILSAKIPELNTFTEGLACQVVTFGEGCGDYHAENITWDDFGCASFDLYVRSGLPYSTAAAADPESTCGSDLLPPSPGEGTFLLGRFTLHVPGEHNVTNAAAALACADLLGASVSSMEAGLSGFTGTDRRFQKKGEIGGVTIIDDYAHHPTEIRATLHAAQKYPTKRIWCVFQPHTYSRTKALFDEFVDALSLVDHVVLADIYAARETDTLGVSSALLCQKLKEKGREAWYFPTFDEIETFLLENCTAGDLLITMGAGDVYRIGERLLGQ